VRPLGSMYRVPKAGERVESVAGFQQRLSFIVDDFIPEVTTFSSVELGGRLSLFHLAELSESRLFLLDSSCVLLSGVFVGIGSSSHSVDSSSSVLVSAVSVSTTFTMQNKRQKSPPGRNLYRLKKRGDGIQCCQIPQFRKF